MIIGLRSCSTKMLLSAPRMRLCSKDLIRFDMCLHGILLELLMVISRSQTWCLVSSMMLLTITDRVWCRQCDFGLTSNGAKKDSRSHQWFFRMWSRLPLMTERDERWYFRMWSRLPLTTEKWWYDCQLRHRSDDMVVNCDTDMILWLSIATQIWRYGCQLRHRYNVGWSIATLIQWW